LLPLITLSAHSQADELAELLWGNTLRPPFSAVGPSGLVELDGLSMICRNG